jgi:hypothetical protein
MVAAVTVHAAISRLERLAEVQVVALEEEEEDSQWRGMGGC